MLTHLEFREIFLTFGRREQKGLPEPAVIREWLRHPMQCGVCDHHWYADQPLWDGESLIGEDDVFRVCLPPSRTEQHAWERFWMRISSLVPLLTN